MTRVQAIGLVVAIVAIVGLVFTLRGPTAETPSAPTAASETTASSSPPPDPSTPPPVTSSSSPPPPLDAALAANDPTDAAQEAATDGGSAPLDMKKWVTEQACTNARNMERARNWEHSAPIKKIFEQEKARCLAGGGHW